MHTHDKDNRIIKCSILNELGGKYSVRFKGKRTGFLRKNESNNHRTTLNRLMIINNRVANLNLFMIVAPIVEIWLIFSLNLINTFR